MARGCPRDGRCNLPRTGECSLSTTTREQRRGLIHEQEDQVQSLGILCLQIRQELILISWEPCQRDGRKESIRTGEYFSSTTVSVNSEQILNLNVFGFSRCNTSFLDTRTTQWEDPRMSNPQIAGPVRKLIL